MYELLREIKYTTNLIYENVYRIVTSGKKIGIYGNGVYALKIEKVLNSWGIDVDYHAVDDEFYYDNLNDSVIKISDLKRFDHSILIIGFETLIGKEMSLKSAISNALLNAPQIEIIDFEHCYLDFVTITYDFFLSNIKEFQRTYDLLEDEISKRVMIEYINNCISGKSEIFGLLNQDSSHDYDYELLLLSMKKGIIVECGAFNGKTAIEICRYLDEKNIEGKVLALEPDEKNYKLLCDNTAGYNRIIPIEKGVSDISGEVLFEENGDSGSSISEIDLKLKESNYSKIKVCSIDDLMQEYGKISAITMDIEGAELNALMGAMKTYKICRPAFAVRVYHKIDDLLRIPSFFDELELEKKYKLYLRNSQNTRGPLDLTLYAI